jgi:hypothetical protein
MGGNREFGHADAASATRELLGDSLKNIVRTKAIDDFLGSDTKPFVVGPKGTGKTLLLLKKAIEKLQNTSVLTIPNNASFPVDRLNGDASFGASFAKRIPTSGEGDAAWIVVWKNAIFKACLYNLCMATGKITSVDLSRHSQQDFPIILSQINSYAQGLIGSPPYFLPKAVFDYYAEILRALDISPPHLIQKFREENGTLKQLLMLVDKPIYVFIDNLDAYYENRPELWFDSMYGLFRCVAEVRLDLRNLHIFTSFRKDVFCNFKTELRQQLLDFVTELRYDNAELLQMFENAIRRLDPSLLDFPSWGRTEPWKAFFGEDRWIHDRLLHNRMVDAQEVILHHSLLRPRDMITIGNKLIESKGNAKMSPSLIHAGIDAAAQEISRQYLLELQPQLEETFNIEDFLKEFGVKNVMRVGTLEEIVRKFNQSDIGRHCAEESGGDGEFNPFAVLYSTGLLGWVRQHERQQWQTFLRPGDSPLCIKRECLPRSQYFIVHPILNHVLGDDRIDRFQMTGYDCTMTIK